jgi:long-chain-fatty-acid--CoA ligase ACSBG
MDFFTLLLTFLALYIVTQLLLGGGSVAVLKEGECESETDAHKSKAEYEKRKGKPFAQTDRTSEMPPRLAATGLASAEGCPPTTLPALFALLAEKKGDKVALQVERPLPALVDGKVPPPLPLESWKKWTNAEYYAETRLVAKAFIALGLERFDGVNIFGFNSPEWFMGEMAAIMAGGVAAGIYPTDTPDQVEYKAKHSSSSIAVVENESKLAIFRALGKAKLPKLKAVVVWAPEDAAALKDFDGVKVVAWSALAELAADASDADLEARIASQKPGHACTYIYTSGTTGMPKAVMISHDNIIFESTCVFHHLPFLGRTEADEERVISFLPLSHVAGMMVDIICPMVLGAMRKGHLTVSFARPYDLKLGSVGDRLRAVRPTLFLGVPRVWEKIAEKMKKIGASTKGLKKKISTWAKAKGLAHQSACQMGGTGAKPPFYALADKIVLKKVKQALGLDFCKFGFTGAAPITTDTLEYFGSLGIQINEVYGMSECTGATTWSCDASHVWGSCGWTMAGMEVKIFRPSDDGSCEEADTAGDLTNPSEAEQGEVCFRGRHIMMGYMANPDMGKEHVAEIQKKTTDAIDADGWLHSGDKGCMDARGMLRITGRYKELIIGAGGENIAPVPIEDNVKKICDAVSNIVMVGDQRKFNIALVTLKAKGATGEKPGGDDLDGGALELLPDGNPTTISGAVKNATFIKAITDAIIATNNDGSVCASNASKIQRFTILKQDFSVESEELTPTLKTKRGVVEKMNAAAIEAVYSYKGKDAFINTL